MFKGDIVQFSPGDLLAFLAHLDKEGILTVTRGDTCLTVSFQGGHIVDASSDLADTKVLGSIHQRGLMTEQQHQRLISARRETNLPLRQILEDTETLTLPHIAPLLLDGIMEVLFQLFSWESGEFQFAEIPLDRVDLHDALECQAAVLETTRRVDEYLEAVRTIGQIDAHPFETPAGRNAQTAGAAERVVLLLSDGTRSFREIWRAAPFSTYEASVTTRRCIDSGWIEVRSSGPPKHEVAGDDHTLFLSYKRALKKVVLAPTPRMKMAEAILFCKEHFDYVLVIASKGERIERCMRFSRDGGDAVRQHDIRDVHPEFGDDPVLGCAHRSKLSFFGETQPSALLERMGERPPAGECAVVPLGTADLTDVIVYAAGARTVGSPGPFTFLELLSWQITPPTVAKRTPARSPSARPGIVTTSAVPVGTGTPDTARNDAALHRMVGSIKELPPLPSAVSRIFQLLSDPNSEMPDLTEVLSLDPALVARLIKVSNSALYGRGQQTASLNQAVVRLGTRTIRSIVLAASTRSMFPTERSGVGMWAQALWQHSVECGLASRRVASAVRTVDPEEAFVGGVLHDIGKVVILLNLPKEYRKIQNARVSKKMSDIQAERDILGFDHTQVGHLLLAKWQMPESLRACVRHHHGPGEAEAHGDLAGVVACGNYFSHLYGSQPDQARADQALDIAAITRDLGLSVEQLQSLREKIPEDIGYSAMLV